MEQDKQREWTRRLKALCMATVATAATAGYFAALCLGKAGAGWMIAVLILDFAAIALIRYSDEPPAPPRTSPTAGRPGLN